ncbi:MAG: hypothetical protein HQL21_04435 [Candidatus Omnitrophica bacterium]|nr:hypothetical protein [Candidatus Omnitrophota bacterium]
MKRYKQGVQWFLRERKKRRAQAILEFTTAAIVFLMLAFGMVQILRWSPRMLYEKTNKHDKCMERSDMSVGCMGEFSATSLDATM